MRLWIGTSGYSYAPWKGRFYPRGLPNADMLAYYAERFPAVEINSSFYKLPTAATVQAWAAGTPPRFRFPLKAPGLITHRRRLRGAEADLARFIEVAAVLGKKLGPLLFQLAPNDAFDEDRLARFLDLLPNGTPATWEFRHASWFREETYRLLRSHRCALCIAESDELATPRVATATWGYLRLRKTTYTDDELSERARWISAQAWTDAYVFLKHEDTARGAGYAARVMEMMTLDGEAKGALPGKRKAESGKRKAESGKRKAESGKRKAESGKRKAESGKRKAESGKRKAESGKGRRVKGEEGSKKMERRRRRREG